MMVDILLTGKNMVLTDEIERFALERFARLVHHRADLERIDVELSREATR